MNHSALSLTIASTCLAVLLAGCASLGTHPPRNTDLTGHWQLDESLSEDPVGAMRANRPRGGHRMHGGWGGMGGGMGMPGGAGGGGGYGRHGGYHGGGWQGGVQRHGPQGEFLQRPATLVIRQTPHELDLEADSVPSEFVYGEKVIASVQKGTAERTSGSNGDAFIVKYRVLDGGPTATRRYELRDGGRQLLVTTELEGGGGRNFKFHTVYTRQG